MDDCSRALKGIAAWPTNTAAANGKARATIFDNVNGLSQEAIEALPAAIYMTDAEGRLTFYNKVAAELWGCRPTLGESKFCGSWKLYWPDGTPLPHDECPMALALRQKRPIRGMEAVAERPDGTRIPFAPYPTPLFDASGRLTGAVNLLVDIRERKQTEQDKQRLAAIVDSSDDAIVSKDLNGIVTSWNPGAERLFGYSAQEMIGKSITLLIPPYLQQEEATILSQIARGERIHHFETTRVRKDGTLVSISLSVSPFRNLHGKVIGASKIARDITDRKKAESALAERNIQLALAGKAALVGSFAYHTDTEIMRISEGYAAIHDLPEGMVELARNQCLATVHPDDIEQVKQLRSEAFDVRGREYSVEYRIIRAGGETRWVETRCFISYTSEGRPQRVIGVSIDITERKRVEEQQRRLVAELDHRVKNVLSTVQAVAAHTMDASSSMEHFVAALDGRIRSLGSTHEILSHRGWQGIPLKELVERELAPYVTSFNAEIGGPDVMLSAEAGQTMGMVIHELVTNAAKYGALSAQCGRVSIRWRLPLNGDPSDRLIFKWQETGGPVPVSPCKSSYGMNVVRELIPYELGGTVEYLLSPEGARCRMDIPLARLRDGSSHAFLPSNDVGKTRAGSSKATFLSMT
jgi:PAS domain S-box-containing protein